MGVVVVSTDGIEVSDAVRSTGYRIGKSLRKDKKQSAERVDGDLYIAQRVGNNVAVLVVAGWRYVVVSYYSIWVSSPPAWEYSFRYPRTQSGVLDRSGMFVLLDAADEAEATGLLAGQPGLYGVPPLPDPLPYDTAVDQSFGRFPPLAPEGATMETFTGGVETVLHAASWYVSSSGVPYSYPLYARLSSSYEPAVFRLTVSNAAPNELHEGDVLVGEQTLRIYEGNYSALNRVELMFQCPTPRGGYALTFGGLLSGEVVVIERNAGGVWGIIFRLSIPPSGLAWRSSSIMRSLDPAIAGVLFTYSPTGPHTYTAIKYSADGSACTIEDWPYMDAEIRAYAEIIRPGWYDLSPAYPSRRLSIYDGHLVWARRVLMPADSPIVLYWEFCASTHPDAETFLVEKLGVNYAAHGNRIIPSVWSDNVGTYDNFRMVGSNRWAFARYARHLR